MEITVRRAVPSDLAAIAALEAACFSFPRSEDYIAHSLDEFLVAEEDGEFLGYTDAVALLDEGYMGNIAVAPQRRGQGVGAALLSALLRWGREKDLAFLTLEVREQNIPARTLYDSRGFVTVGVRKNYYEKPTDNAVLMTYYYKEGTQPC